MEKNSQKYYYHLDGLGSVTGITDATGNVVQRYEYDSYGNIVSVLDPDFIQPYTYTAREYDPESGLYFYRARYYDAKAGRFVSEDPIGFNSGDVNFYAYVGNNPVNFVDPQGLGELVCKKMTNGTISCYFTQDPPVPCWLCDLSIHTLCHVACHKLGGNFRQCLPICIAATEYVCSEECKEKECK
jgi:RHS repeat-associated protein